VDDPAAPPSAPADPHRELPPSTATVYGFLLGLLALCCLACTAAGGFYAYFLHVKSLR